jgi:hypothetical protein
MLYFTNKQLNAWIDQRLTAQQAAELHETPPVNEL